jgi:hypothetical protein
MNVNGSGTEDKCIQNSGWKETTHNTCLKDNIKADLKYDGM